MVETRKSKMTASEVTQAEEDRIVELSLQNPDYGARRLASLLHEDGITISASTVYSIQMRKGL